MANTGDKPKTGTYKAPQFRHLPAEKARKLKQAWIAKQKIKNAYRAQKRTGKLDAIPSDRLRDSGWSGRFKPDPLEADDDSTQDIPEHTPESISTRDTSVPTPSTFAGLSRGKPTASAPSKSPQANSQLSPSKTPTQPHPMRQNRKLKSNSRPLLSGSVPGVAAADAEQGGKSTEQPNLRELMRDAYSRSSLHTFKSDTLHRRHKGETSSNGRGRGVGLSAAGRTGRGQADMRKRMGALLAQIKSTTA